MRKLYLLIIVQGFLLANNKLSAQCSVNISTNPNTTQLNCTTTSIKLTADIAGTSGPVTFVWSTGDTTASINVTDAANYKVTIKDTEGCNASSSVNITKNIIAPVVSILAFPDSICSGSTSTLVALGAVTYSWQPGSQTVNPVTVNPATTTIYTVTGKASNGCIGTSTFTLFVHPLPTASISGDATVCQNAAQPGITFTGLSGTKPFNFTYNIDGGSGQIITTNGNNATVTVNAPTGILGSFVYNLISVGDGNGCTQAQNGTARIAVNPGPILTSSKTASVCDNKRFTYAATSSATGTNFNWSRAVVTGVSNPAVTGNSANIDETLDNITSQPVVVKYVLTLSTGTGCVTTDSVMVTVNPTPVLNTITNKSYCNGEFVNGGIPFTSSSPATAFSWTNSNPNIGLAVNGKGNIPAFIATNTGGNSINATITVFIKASADSCAGANSTFTITVLPAPVLTSAKTASICDNAAFTYTATGSAAGTNFSWTRAVVTGISNPAGTRNSPDINETLDNITSQPVVVKYVFTLSTGTGCITTDSVMVTVNPTPAINAISNKSYCNGEFVIGGIPFSSISPAAVFSWTNSNPNIGLPISGSGSILPFNAKNATSSPIAATITVSIKASADSCAGTNSTFTITVLPAPVLTSAKTTSICNNAAFTYTATGSAAGTNFSWARAVVSGISNPAGIGNSAIINETLDNLTTQPVVVKYVFTLSTGTGCITTDSVKVTVNPTPVLNAITNKSYCNGEFVSGGIPFTSSSPAAGFSWTNNNPNIGLAASGSGSILPFNAKDTADSPIIATITVFIKASGDSCLGTTSSFTITVFPGPILTSLKTLSVCNNKPFNYLATSSAVGTNFNWTRVSVPGISNPAASGTSSTVSETLHNTTSQPVVVKYVFSLSTGTGCVTLDSVMVTVNPTPVIDSLNNKSYCNGDFVNRGIPFMSSSPGAAFTWTNSNPNIGLPISGNGSILPFNATNTTASPISATITVSIKASADSCTGATSTFTITVLPAPVLTSAKTADICDSTLFSYLATSYANNTNFRWTRAFVSGINNAAASDTIGTIRETLDNITSQPVDVFYVFILSAGSGCVTTDSVKVTVNPTPVIDSITGKSYCNNSLVQPIIFTSSTKDAMFIWTCNPSIGFGTGGTNHIPAFITNNQSISSLIANVKVRISVGNNCMGDSVAFAMIVNPTPALANTKDTSVCDNAQFTFKAKSSVAGTGFSWTRPFVAGISNAAASGVTENINEKLDNTTSQPVDVFYIFNLTVGSGCVITDSVKVTVNPTPVINQITTPPPFCNGTAVRPISFSSSSPNATFTWTCDTTIGFGVTGSDSIPSFIASNTGITPIKATVRVNITASSDHCPGPNSTFIITVNPSPQKPNFTSFSQYPDNEILKLCSGTENINFNVNSPIPGITYRWMAKPGNSPLAIIKNTDHPNTAISFRSSGTDTLAITLIATDRLTCGDSVSQIVKIGPVTGINERKIFLKQPGNLLIYPDNSLDSLKGYQWGYDSLVQTNPVKAFSSPIPVTGQVYQTFIPEGRFIKNNQLDTAFRTFWVLLQEGECYSRVYYNGPYAFLRPGIAPPVNNTVQLKVIPNPNNGLFEINLKGNIYGNIDAKIYNSIGQVVFSKDFTKTTPEINEQVNTGNFPNGLYFLVLNSSDLQKVVSRFIIQH